MSNGPRHRRNRQSRQPHHHEFKREAFDRVLQAVDNIDHKPEHDSPTHPVPPDRDPYKQIPEDSIQFMNSGDELAFSTQSQVNPRPWSDPSLTLRDRVRGLQATADHFADLDAPEPVHAADTTIRARARQRQGARLRDRAVPWPAKEVGVADRDTERSASEARHRIPGIVYSIKMTKAEALYASNASTQVSDSDLKHGDAFLSLWCSSIAFCEGPHALGPLRDLADTSLTGPECLARLERYGHELQELPENELVRIAAATALVYLERAQRPSGSH